MHLCDVREVLLENMAEDVLQEKLMYRLRDKTKFKAKNMEKMLREALSPSNLPLEKPTNVAVLSANVTDSEEREAKPYVFRNYILPKSESKCAPGASVVSAAEWISARESAHGDCFSDENWWLAARASMAAPGFFKPVKTTRGKLLIDGGVISNCPAQVAVNEFSSMYGKEPISVFLSLGNGTEWQNMGKDSDLTLTPLKATFVKNLSDSDAMFEKVRSRVAGHNTSHIFRWNPYLGMPPPSIDETTPEHLVAIEEKAVRSLYDGESEGAELSRVLALLATEPQMSPEMKTTFESSTGLDVDGDEEEMGSPFDFTRDEHSRVEDPIAAHKHTAATTSTTAATNGSKEMRESSAKSQPVVWHLKDSCELCLDDFTFFSRRHHCRVCGFSCCSRCSPHSLKLEAYGDTYQRVCTPCLATANGVVRGSCSEK